MAKLRPIALVLARTVLAVPASAHKSAAGPGSDCVVTRILADGREVRAAMPPGLSGHASAGRGFATSRASARSSGRSAVSVSSSSASASSGGGRGHASSVTSHTDEAGRTITMRRDRRGCTVVIDERTIGEE